MVNLNAGDDFITIARIAKTQGRHGEVAVELHTHVPDRLQPGMRLFLLLDGGGRRELNVEGIWPHKQYVVVKLAGVRSIDDAQALVGRELQVPGSERAPLAPGASYISDLIGCVVVDGDRRIGTIQDVRSGAGEAPLLVLRSGGRELEIPYAQEFLVHVDLAQKRIAMHLPEGLLEVNAPLTEEEKQSFKGQSRQTRRA